MVWVGRNVEDHPVPTPCHRQGHLPLDHVAQSHARTPITSITSDMLRFSFSQLLLLFKC